MSVRDSFVERFGEEQAKIVEAAAVEHDNDVHNKRGSDPFRWAICIALGFDCMKVDGYREHHGFTAPWSEVQDWIKKEAHLENHDGAVDYLSLFAGTYNEYVPASPKGTP